MEYPTHSFRETNLVLQLKLEPQIKSRHFLYRLFFLEGIFLTFVLCQCIVY